MATILAKKLFFPCAAPNYRRVMMAANTHTENGIRIVAFEKSDDAREALELSRHGELTLVVGPALKYPIAAIDPKLDTHVWNASAVDVINCGITRFHLDVCELSERRDIDVITSYNVFMDKVDDTAARLNLQISWEI